MKNCIRLCAALVSIAVVAACFGIWSRDGAEAAVRQGEQQPSAPGPQQAQANMTAMPGSDDGDSHYGPSFSYLAWDLFMEVMSPTNGSPTFESWTEQCQLNPNTVGCPTAARVSAARAASNGQVRLLHASAGNPYSRRIAGTDCGTMITTPVGGYPAPSNLTPNAVYCEEVFVSPPEASFIKRNFTTLVSQQTYGNARNGDINLPGTEQNEYRVDLDSVEVKVDWVPATSYSPTFACPDTKHRLYTETINGTCYALAAVHISSKVMLNWFWATFEPDSNITNPNRCDAKLYGPCIDPWGTTSRQPYGKGQTAKQSPELRQAMAAAHLNSAFRNYFLTGVQTQFVDNDGKPTQLGNSFVEFNQGVAPGKSSCITCHQYARFDGKQPPHGAPENDFGRPLQGWPSIGYACDQNQNGNCLPESPHSATQDFSWMLGLMPYSDPDAKAPAEKSQAALKY